MLSAIVALLTFLYNMDVAAFRCIRTVLLLDTLRLSHCLLKLSIMILFVNS